MQYSFLSSCRYVLPDLVDTRRHSKLHCTHSTGVIVVVIAYIFGQAKTCKNINLIYWIADQKQLSKRGLPQKLSTDGQSTQSLFLFLPQHGLQRSKSKKQRTTQALSSRQIDSIACDSAYGNSFYAYQNALLTALPSLRTES